jgi:hypothetical protein
MQSNCVRLRTYAGIHGRVPLTCFAAGFAAEETQTVAAGWVKIGDARFQCNREFRTDG